ncbi:Flavin monooxygenase-like protein [Akanthomyces lecanii RCEF 1005]|uniref:Flavin monooxygenase-like protein n=1 Tax=Akanthomyces lecanii RCEF 1005 TaxID=1081108 RepID=A0A168FH84_CORDF|nr:Flavin monooxygenase-like protein [Akanthomyces lecanii RCEF 1005]
MAEGFFEYPPRTAFPNLVLHETTVREDINPTAIAEKWLSGLAKHVTAKDAAAFRDLFFAESWWRDSVGFSWTITSKKGPDAISNHVFGSDARLEHASVVSDVPALAPQLVDMGPMTMVQFGYVFKTQYGQGRGIVRLGNDDGPESWKAWTVSSQLEGLRDASATEEIDVFNQEDRVNGAKVSNDYQVLIVGAGQSGAMLGAWLKKLNIRYLIIDKALRPGDAWRARYASIQSHTPSYGDHFSFLDFPDTFPKWPSRDDIADWIDQYSATMDLNILPGATVTSIRRREEAAAASQYTINMTLNHNSEQKTYTATHVVLATGIFPPIPIIPSFPGLDAFPGQTYHAALHTSAGAIPDLDTKNVVVIGAGTSAHDIAQDFVAHGAKSTTMVQRSRIWTASTSTVEQFIFAPWNTPGVDTASADLLGTSFPAAVALTLGAGMAPLMAAHDKPLLDGLEAAGMRLARGDDGISLLDYQVVKITGFYIDQGAGQMIIDGRIQVLYCADGVAEFGKQGVRLADGTQISADVVVLATGFRKMTETMEGLLGEELAKRADNPCVGLDAETERAGLTRPTGVPGLWYMAGSFMMGRQLSKLLALQIAAVERGINQTHFTTSASP